MKHPGKIWFFPAEFDDQTSEISLNNCWFNKHFFWLFMLITDLEGMVCWVCGLEQFFIFKFKDKNWKWISYNDRGQQPGKKDEK